MKYTLSTFTVGEEHLKAAQRALAELTGALRRHEPGTLFLVFREEDRPAFRCVMAFADEAAERAHATAPYVEQFARKLQQICVGSPCFVDLGYFLGTHAVWNLEEAALAAGHLNSPGKPHSRRPRHLGRLGHSSPRPASTR